MKKPVKIGVFCHKGGVGKTATVAALADAASCQGPGRVLVIDSDEQSCQKTIFGVKMHETNGGLSSILLGQAALKDVVTNVRPNIDLLLSGGRHIRKFEERVSEKKENRPELLMRKAFKGQLSAYDYVFVDCPPHISAVAANIATFCDYMLVPCQADLLGFAGMRQTLFFYEGLSKDYLKTGSPIAKVLGAVLTQYAAKQTVDMAIEADLASMEANGLISRIYKPIPKDTKVRMAQLKRKLLSEGFQNSKAAIAYRELFHDLLEDIAKVESKAPQLAVM